MTKQIIIKGKALENLAKHSQQYTGDVQALLITAEFWGYKVHYRTDALIFTKPSEVLELLADISDIEKCATDGVVECGWCGSLKPRRKAWDLELLDIHPQPHIRHFCFDCADVTKTVDFIAFVLGW